MRDALRRLPLLASLAIPLAGAAQAPAPAFSATPLRVRVPAGGPSMTASLAPFSVPWTVVGPPPYASNDLFVSVGQAVERHAWRDLAAPADAVFGASPNPVTCFAAGLLDEAGGDGLADVAYCSFSGALSGLFTFFGDAPLTPFFASTGLANALSTAHLLDARRDVLAAGYQGNLTAVDIGGTSSAPAVTVATWPSGQIASGDDVPLPVRLSGAARGPAQVHDLVRSMASGVHVLWNLGPATTLSTAGFQLVYVPLGPAPSGYPVRGAAALDVDFDGIPDLVACLYSVVSGPPPTGPQLVWVKSDGASPAALTTNPQGDLGAILGVSQARLCRPVDLDGTPGLALWDAVADQIVVVTSDAAGRRLLTWRAPAQGRIPTDIKAGDVVGSPLADLVVTYPFSAEVDVFPDVGDQLPDLAWSQVPPATAIRGRDLALPVTASDDGAVERVEWFVNGSDIAAAADTAAPYIYTIPGQSLCGVPGPLDILVRATDDVGLYRELEAAIALVEGPPELSLSGEGGVLGVPLVPGGTSIAIEAGVSGTCGATLDWTPPAALLAAGATARRTDVAGGARLIIDIPEAAYPAILAQPSLAFAAEVLAASPGGSTSASVTIQLDASRLVAVEQASDRTALAPGDLALLTATVRSGISVTLPEVLLDDHLDGLEPAGPVRVDGAEAGPALPTAAGLGVTFALPGGGRPVTVELPVRRTLAPGGSSRVLAVAPASGAPVSREARIDTPSATLPGCGCGAGGGGPASALLLLLYMKAMRRVLASTRSTSSSTPMRRQA